MDWAKTTAGPDKRHLTFGIWCKYIRVLTVCHLAAIDETYPDTLSCSQVSANHLKIGHPKSKVAQSSDKLQWLDLKMKHQDSSSSNCHQCDVPCYSSSNATERGLMLSDNKHYLNQWWQSSMILHGNTKGSWDKTHPTKTIQNAC